MSSDDVPVELLEHTPEPTRRVCSHARNDYLDAKLPELSYEEVMADVDGETLADKERTLIKKLMLRGHWGPLEHVYLSFWTRASRSAMGQITRHRHATFDIQSMRYVDMSEKGPDNMDDFRWPRTWDQEEVSTREGTRELESTPEYRETVIYNALSKCLEAYQELVAQGIPKEDARMVLPIGTKVNITVSMNMRAFFHILNMRGPKAGDAQAEIGQIAEGMKEEVRKVAPLIMDVWDSNRDAIARQRLSP